MTHLIRPHININGTEPQELIKFRVLAKRALEEVIDYLKACTPNGRDYPAERDLLEADRAAHYARIAMLRDLQATLLDEALLIQKQKEA